MIPNHYQPGGYTKKTRCKVEVFVLFFLLGYLFLDPWAINRRVPVFLLPMDMQARLSVKTMVASAFPVVMAATKDADSVSLVATTTIIILNFATTSWLRPDVPSMIKGAFGLHARR